MSQRNRILLGYGIPLACLLVFYWVASDGHHPDASPKRTLLYWLFFLILPVGFGAFIIHLTLTICTADQRRRAMPLAFIGGLLGPVFLGIAIATSTDGEAAMGLIAMPLAYCVAAPIAGVLAILAIKTYDYFRNRSVA